MEKHEEAQWEHVEPTPYYVQVLPLDANGKPMVDGVYRMSLLSHRVERLVWR